MEYKISRYSGADNPTGGLAIHNAYGARNEISGTITFKNDRFDTLESQFATRRFLLLGYRNGLQVWDCTHLGSVSEIINLRGRDWNRVAHAAVLPEVSAVQRPCLGLLTGQGGDAAFIVYSLQQHAIVIRILEPELVSFEATENFVVLGTASPTALHALSATSFAWLSTIPPSALAPSSAL